MSFVQPDGSNAIQDAFIRLFWYAGERIDRVNSRDVRGKGLKLKFKNV